MGVCWGFVLDLLRAGLGLDREHSERRNSVSASIDAYGPNTLNKTRVTQGFETVLLVVRQWLHIPSRPVRQGIRSLVCAHNRREQCQSADQVARLHELRWYICMASFWSLKPPTCAEMQCRTHPWQGQAEIMAYFS